MSVPFAQIPAKVQHVVYMSSRLPEQTIKHRHFAREGGRQFLELVNQIHRCRLEQCGCARFRDSDGGAERS